VSSAPVVGLVALLAGALLLIVGLVVWQSARSGAVRDQRSYVLDDAIRHVQERLGRESPLARRDVRRILEYEVFYLQGLAQADRRSPVVTVAGGHEASINYIASEIEARHGAAYSHSDIEEVLRLESGYLAVIGAVGDPVDLGESE